MNPVTPTSPSRPEWDEVLARYHPTLLRHLDAALYAWLRVHLQDDEEDCDLLSDMCFSHYWRFHDTQQAWAAIGMLPPWTGLLT